MKRAPLLFALLLASMFPPAAHAYPTVEGHPAEYVILTGDALVPAFQPLADWKTRSGVPAVIRPLSAVLAAHPIAFDDAERIRLEIRDAWLAGARWVLLGGGPTVLPLRYAHTTYFGGWDLPTDLYFQCLDGTWDADGDHIYGEGTISSSDPGDNADLIPEVSLGRAPVADFAQAQRFVAKTLGYQRTPAGGYEHLSLEAAEVLFPTNWMPGDPVTLDGADLVEALLPLFDTHPSLHVARLYANYTDPSRRPGALPENLATVRDSLNRGANQVLMVGRGNTHTIGVGDAFMGEPDFATLTNGARLFNLYTVGTSSTAVDSGGIGRAAMLAPFGGAVSCIGSSHFEFPTAARNFLQEFFRVVEQDSATALGEAIARSRLPFVPFSAFDGVNRWTEMTQTLLGDPEMRMWTGPVRAMAVIHLPGVVVGDDHLNVLALAGSGPLAGARVCAWRPGIFLSVGFTDYAGFVHLPITAVTPGSFLLTVTGFDAHPYETTIDIASGPTPALAALVGVAAVEAGVELTGFLPDGAGTEVTLQRSSGGLEWRAIVSGHADGSGRVTLLDRDAQPGTSYHYRLALLDRGVERYSSELEFRVPARLALAVSLAGVQPSTGPVSVRLSLPVSSRVSIEGIDPSGRRRFARELGVLAAGVSTIRVPEADALPPGVYFVRLRQGERSALTRFVRLQ